MKSIRFVFLLASCLMILLGAESGLTLESVVKHFGRPDVDDSTAYDKPRPPLVTRILIYKRQNVEFILQPLSAPDHLAGVNQPPPYIGWQVLTMVDARTKQPIKAEEVLRRMGKPAR